MRSGAEIFRKPGGLLVLLAFFLSLLPAATQAAVAAVPHQRLVVELADSLTFEAKAAATIPQASISAHGEADEFSGDGFQAPLPWVPAIAGSLPPRAGRFLPPATAPPASGAADAYRARAPPVR